MGLFFKDYESAGSGIPNHAPKKKGFALFFEITGRKFWRLAGLNFLYFLFLIPLMLILPVISFVSSPGIGFALIILLLLTFAFTIGPATAGMVKVLRCFLIEKHTYICRDFFRGFKSNFKYASVIGFVDCIVLVSAMAAVRVYPALADQLGTGLMYVPLVFTYSFALLVVMMNYYIYLMMVATSLSLKNLIKNSFMLAFVAIKRNLFTTLMLFIIVITMFGTFVYFPQIFMVIVPFYPAAFIGLIASFRSYPVIQEYVINPYYTSIGQINPELTGFAEPTDEEPIFKDMGGKEEPIQKRKKGKGKRIS